MSRIPEEIASDILLFVLSRTHEFIDFTAPTLSLKSTLVINDWKIFAHIDKKSVISGNPSCT